MAAPLGTNDEQQRELIRTWIKSGLSTRKFLASDLCPVSQTTFYRYKRKWEKGIRAQLQRPDPDQPPEGGGGDRPSDPATGDESAAAGGTQEGPDEPDRHQAQLVDDRPRPLTGQQLLTVGPGYDPLADMIERSRRNHTGKLPAPQPEQLPVPDANPGESTASAAPGWRHQLQGIGTKKGLMWGVLGFLTVAAAAVAGRRAAKRQARKNDLARAAAEDQQPEQEQERSLHLVRTQRTASDDFPAEFTKPT